MRMSSSLAAAAFILSLVTSAGAMAANFSGVPETPEQQALMPTVPQVTDDPPALPQLRHVQTGPYDSLDFVVPPYEIYP